MKTSLLVLFASIILFIITPTISGQELALQNKNESTSAHYLQVNLLNETGLFYHYAINNTFSLKTGLSASLSLDQGKGGDGYTIQKYSGTNERTSTTSNQSLNQYNITASSQLLYRLNNFKYATIFLGLGAAYNYSFSKSNSNRFSHPIDSTFQASSAESWNSTKGIGPSCSFLIKSKIYSGFSLLAEFNLSALYTWTKSKWTTNNESVYQNGSYSSFYENFEQGKGWSIKLSNVKVGFLIAL